MPAKSKRLTPKRTASTIVTILSFLLSLIIPLSPPFSTHNLCYVVYFKCRYHGKKHNLCYVVNKQLLYIILLTVLYYFCHTISINFYKKTKILRNHQFYSIIKKPFCLFFKQNLKRACFFIPIFQIKAEVY